MLLRLTLSLAAVLLAGCVGPPDPCLEDDPPAGLVCPVAGTGEQGFNRDGRDPRNTDLYLVSSARWGPDGLVYIMDFNNQRLRLIEENGDVRTIAGNGFHAFAAADTPALDSPLENPIDFGFLPSGEVVFVSYHDPRVLRVDGDGVLRVVAGSGEIGMRGNEGDFGPPLSAAFMQLDGIAVRPDGALYVSDSLANRVRLIESDVIQTVAGTGRGRYSGDGGPGVDADLQWPTALELDAEGNLLIADTRNHVVRRLATDGTITTIVGNGTQGFSGDGGPATDAQLDQPNGLAIADDGTLYVADRGNFRVRRVSPDNIIDTVAGTGENGLAGDGGPALDARFGYVARVALDGDGLLVADQSNSCVRRVLLD